MTAMSKHDQIREEWVEWFLKRGFPVSPNRPHWWIVVGPYAIRLGPMQYTVCRALQVPEFRRVGYKVIKRTHERLTGGYYTPLKDVLGHLHGFVPDMTGRLGKPRYKPDIRHSRV